MTSTVLVTGAGGFIGRALVKQLLENGQDVVATDVDLRPLRAQLGGDELAASNLTLVEGDIGDSQIQTRCTHDASTVYHLAAAHLSVSSPDSEYRRVNIDAVRSLVDSCHRSRVERFVHLSTVGVFGAIDNPPADEDTPCRPESIYDRTKLEGERVVLEAASESGFPATILRPAWVYGAGDPRTEKLFRALSKGRFLQAGPGDRLRHSIYVDDMVQACLTAAASDDALGRVLIIGDQKPVTVAELLGTIAETCGASPPRRIPLWMLWLAGLGAEAAFGILGKEPPLSRRTLRFFTGNAAFDTTRAKDALGFVAKYDLPRGLEATYQQIRAAG